MLGTALWMPRSTRIAGAIGLLSGQSVALLLTTKWRGYRKQIKPSDGSSDMCVCVRVHSCDRLVQQWVDLTMLQTVNWTELMSGVLCTHVYVHCCPLTCTQTRTHTALSVILSWMTSSFRILFDSIPSWFPDIGGLTISVALCPAPWINKIIWGSVISSASVVREQSPNHRRF